MKKLLKFTCLFLCLLIIGTFTVACGGGGGSSSGGGFGYIPTNVDGNGNGGNNGNGNNPIINPNNGNNGNNTNPVINPTNKTVTLNDEILQQLYEIGIITTADKRELTSVNIPATYTYNGITYTITAIGDYAFAITENNSKNFTKSLIVTKNNTTLKNVTIPNTVTKIGEGAFFGCTELENLTIPASVTEIGSNAFYNIPKITYNGNAEGAVNGWGSANVNSDNYTEIELDSETIERLTSLGIFETDDLGRRTDVIIPSVFEYNGTKYKITKIAKEAFKNNTTLTSVIIPNSVTEIGQFAFSGCTSLETAIIGDGVKDLGQIINPTTSQIEHGGIFNNCSSLKNIIIGKSVESIVYTFPNCTSLENIEIPDNVKYIGWFCFSNCTSLKEIPIGNGVETIGNNAFAKMGSTDTLVLESIIIPDNVKTIGQLAFDGCTALKEVTFGSGIETIERYAFFNCTSLEATIPDSVTTIGESAFYNVPHIYYNGTAEGRPWGAKAIN